MEQAVQTKKKAPKNDVFWVVYDRESARKYSDERHLKAREKAASNGINVALSNVCFEQWLLLHFEYSAAAYYSYDDLMSRSTLKAKLNQLGIEKYDKGCADIFKLVGQNNGIQKARDNARKLVKAMAGEAEFGKEAPSYLNPYVEIHLLLDTMDNFVSRN